jgi:hypothetical protein
MFGDFKVEKKGGNELIKETEGNQSGVIQERKKTKSGSKENLDQSQEGMISLGNEDISKHSSKISSKIINKTKTSKTIKNIQKMLSGTENNSEMESTNVKSMKQDIGQGQVKVGNRKQFFEDLEKKNSDPPIESTVKKLPSNKNYDKTKPLGTKYSTNDQVPVISTTVTKKSGVDTQTETISHDPNDRSLVLESNDFGGARTLYLNNDKSRENYKVTFMSKVVDKNGEVTEFEPKLYMKDDKGKFKEMDTSHGRGLTVGAEDGQFIFVMGKDGEFYSANMLLEFNKFSDTGMVKVDNPGSSGIKSQYITQGELTKMTKKPDVTLLPDDGTGIAKYTVNESHGSIFEKGGTVTQEHLDTENARIQNISDTLKYTVVNENIGDLKERFHHSTFLGGQEVGGAGTIQVLDGKIAVITDASGHYKPEVNQLVNVIDEIEHRGVKIENVGVKLVQKVEGDGSENVSAMRVQSYKDEPNPELDIRLKNNQMRSVQQEFMEKLGSKTSESLQKSNIEKAKHFEKRAGSETDPEARIKLLENSIALDPENDISRSSLGHYLQQKAENTTDNGQKLKLINESQKHYNKSFTLKVSSLEKEIKTLESNPPSEQNTSEILKSKKTLAIIYQNRANALKDLSNNPIFNNKKEALNQQALNLEKKGCEIGLDINTTIININQEKLQTELSGAVETQDHIKIGELKGNISRAKTESLQLLQKILPIASIEEKPLIEEKISALSENSDDKLKEFDERVSNLEEKAKSEPKAKFKIGEILVEKSQYLLSKIDLSKSDEDNKVQILEVAKVFEKAFDNCNQNDDLTLGEYGLRAAIMYARAGEIDKAKEILTAINNKGETFDKVVNSEGRAVVNQVKKDIIEGNIPSFPDAFEEFNNACVG